ncbi:MAG: hypothetical protein Q8R24_00305 [Legionellaceae bacterium]|nr:hypothetical protein [Legionellaceae bacterium]
MPTSSGTTVGTSQAPLPTLPRSPRIAISVQFQLILRRKFEIVYRESRDTRPATTILKITDIQYGE